MEKKTFKTGAECLDILGAYRDLVNEKVFRPMGYNDYVSLRKALQSAKGELFVIAFISDGISNSIKIKNWSKPSEQPIFCAETYRNPEVDCDSFANPFANYLWANYNNIITNNTEKENDSMNKMFNFEFGPVDTSLVRMSMYGLAVKNKSGVWVSYDAANEDIMDVEIFNFDGAKFLYKMPVAIKDIAVGDVVIHNRAPMFVVGIPADHKALTVVDSINGERKEIMLTKSPFGFNFATKVVNFLGDMFAGGSATAENPFGNMWMLMAMDNKDSIADVLPMMMMANGGIADSTSMMWMLCLAGNGGNSDMGKMMGMMAVANAMKSTSTNTCNCGCNCATATEA